MITHIVRLTQLDQRITADTKIHWLHNLALEINCLTCYLIIRKLIKVHLEIFWYVPCYHFCTFLKSIKNQEALQVINCTNLTHWKWEVILDQSIRQVTNWMLEQKSCNKTGKPPSRLHWAVSFEQTAQSSLIRVKTVCSSGCN